MRRGIDLLNKQYEVTLLSRTGEWFLQVNDGTPQPVLLTQEENGDKTIRLGNLNARIQMAVSGGHCPYPRFRTDILSAHRGPG